MFQCINLTPWQLSMNQETSQQHPKVSVSLRNPAILDWLDAISESNAILSAILAVIHPKLYNAGWETTKHLKDPEICPRDILIQWASVFSGVAVISNCITKPHQDLSSRVNSYDILASSGSYRDCILKLLGLGISLEYGPGTVVGMAGKVLEHEVPSFEGDRVCYAYFMRDNVHEWAKVPCCDWMKTDYYE